MSTITRLIVHSSPTKVTNNITNYKTFLFVTVVWLCTAIRDLVFTAVYKYIKAIKRFKHTEVN